MAQTLKRPAPPCKAAAGPEMLRMPTLRVPEDSAPLSAFQADFLAARFGLNASHARVVAQLAWGRA